MKNRLMPRTFGFILGLVLTSVLTLPVLHAAESKPVLTVSTANPETLLNVAEKIATLTGTLDSFNEGAAPFKEFKGIASRNPAVFVLHAEGSEFKDPLLFLPITKLEDVEIPGFEMLLAQAKKETDGKYLLNSPMGAYVMTQKKGYLVLSAESSEMPIPDDPVKYIESIKDFTLGVRLDIENTSAEAVQLMLAPFQLMAGMQGGEQAIKAFEQINQAVEIICKEARSISFGISMDPKSGDVNFQSLTVAKKGSDTEKQIEFLNNAKTVFNGFCGDDTSVASFSSIGKGLKDQPEQLRMTEEQVDQLITGLLEQVEENAESDEDVELAEAIAKSAQKMLLATIALEKIDVGFSLGSDGTFALGTTIAEGKELETVGSLVLKRLGNISPDKEKFEDAVKKIKTNFATVEGFQLSSFVFPLKECAAEDENFPKFLADKTFYVYWGLKDDAFVLLGGFDPKSEELLKTAIAATKKPVPSQGGNGTVSMVQLGKLLKAFQVETISPEAALVAMAFLKAGSDAKITFSQSVGKDSVDQKFFISGKIWEAAAKIRSGIESSATGGAPNLKIRELN